MPVSGFAVDPHTRISQVQYDANSPGRSTTFPVRATRSAPVYSADASLNPVATILNPGQPILPTLVLPPANLPNLQIPVNQQKAPFIVLRGNPAGWKIVSPKGSVYASMPGHEIKFEKIPNSQWTTTASPPGNIAATSTMANTTTTTMATQFHEGVTFQPELNPGGYLMPELAPRVHSPWRAVISRSRPSSYYFFNYETGVATVNPPEGREGPFEPGSSSSCDPFSLGMDSGSERKRARIA
jgi:hypothetical protein